jgi:hypothetical protein
MKRMIITVNILLTLIFVLPALAQEGGTKIEYGQTVTGEITNQNFEVPFTFEGNQGDVVVIEMAPVDVLGDLNSPSVILLDAGFNMLGSVDSGFGTAVFASKLPGDGEYTILASRRDGRAGDSVGQFTLQLIKPPVLKVGESIQDMVSSEATNYYVVETQGPFSISYEKLSGDFYPAVLIHLINDDNELEEVASMQGKSFVQGTLGIETASITTSIPYCVTVQEALFDFNFDEVTADYSLTLTQ